MCYRVESFIVLIYSSEKLPLLVPEFSRPDATMEISVSVADTEEGEYSLSSSLNHFFYQK